ncbi:hypothetical protein CES87_04040 [Pseudomonas sp. ERMR1:02]|nr:hypothetical protein CES87_04040 [Pseudomonas sp. ERMR1:02]
MTSERDKNDHPLGRNNRQENAVLAYSTRLHHTSAFGAGKLYEEYTASLDACSPPPAQEGLVAAGVQNNRVVVTTKHITLHRPGMTGIGRHIPTENIIAEPLKVERSTVTKRVITGAPRLNPITVFLEDFGRRHCPIVSGSRWPHEAHLPQPANDPWLAEVERKISSPSPLCLVRATTTLKTGVTPSVAQEPL